MQGNILLPESWKDMDSQLQFPCPTSKILIFWRSIEKHMKNLQYEKPFQKKTVCKTSCTCANDKTGKSHQNLSVFNNKLRIDFTIQAFVTLRHV